MNETHMVPLDPKNNQMANAVIPVYGEMLSVFLSMSTITVLAFCICKSGQNYGFD